MLYYLKIPLLVVVLFNGKTESHVFRAFYFCFILHQFPLVLSGFLGISSLSSMNEGGLVVFLVCKLANEFRLQLLLIEDPLNSSVAEAGGKLPRLLS